MLDAAIEQSMLELPKELNDSVIDVKRYVGIMSIYSLLFVVLQVKILFCSTLKHKMVPDEYLPIEVRRDFLLQDALREARKIILYPNKYLKVRCT